MFWRSRKNDLRYRVSIHSRLVLLTSGCLLLAGWLLYTIFEWNVTLRELPPALRVLNGLFMSVTARTAGFHTVDYAQTGEASSFLTILLMSIGGSPGSTAGGLKTTTFALLGILALSRLRGFRAAQIWHRSIPEENVQRAVGLFVVAFGFVSAGIFGYMELE